MKKSNMVGCILVGCSLMSTVAEIGDMSPLLNPKSTQFMDELEMHRDQISSHNVDTTSSKSLHQSYTCQVRGCLLKASDLENLSRHGICHGQEGFIYCSTCNKYVSDEEFETSHIGDHLAQQAKSALLCNECGLHFTTIKHSSTHTGFYRNPCEQLECEFITDSLETLAKHNQIVHKKHE